MNNLSSYLCNTPGCSFDASKTLCANATGDSTVCQQSWKDFCAQNSSGAYNCKAVYSGGAGIYPPNSCEITESVKPTAVVNESYSQFLQVGTNVLYSYKNKTINSGFYVGGSFVPLQSGVLVTNTSNLSISHAQLYIVYLNSFAVTGNAQVYPPNTISLPSECSASPSSWLNNYPTDCFKSCVTAGAFYGTLLGRSNVGISSIGTGAAIGGIAGTGAVTCGTNKLCNQYVLQPAWNVVTTGLWTTSGLSSCFSCLSTYVTNKQAVLGNNKMYVCAVVS